MNQLVLDDGNQKLIVTKEDNSKNVLIGVGEDRKPFKLDIDNRCKLVGFLISTEDKPEEAEENKPEEAGDNKPEELGF
jgi:hypothetical protein